MTDVIKIIEPATTVITIAGLQGPQGPEGPVGGEIPGTPTITSFENAQHDHLDADGGGQITAAALSDFDTEVSNNTDVAANTTHRGTTTGNPHNVTKSDVGLGNVPNTDATARANHTGTQTASTISDFDTEVSNNTDVAANTTHRGTTTGNPHNVTKSDVGLGNVPNTDATARANHTGTQTASTISDFDTAVSANGDVAAAAAHILDTDNPHSVTKSQVGLGNVGNTLHNFTATTAPTADDNSGDGYSVGSMWFDTAADKFYACQDATLGAAVWVDPTARANHTGTQAASTISDFDTEVSNNTDVAANTTHRGVTTGNPHNVTKSDVGLGNVPNTDATARANHTGTQAASTISDFDTEVSNNTDVAANTTHRGLTNNPHSVTKTQVGLGNVANVDTTNAANISSGVLNNSRVNWAAPSAIGGTTPNTGRFTRLVGTVDAIADDAVLVYSVGVLNGTVLISDNGGVKIALVYFRTQASFTPVVIVETGVATLDLSSSVLNGTTGTDGRVTFAANTNGNLYLENRTGVARGFTLTVFA